MPFTEICIYQVKPQQTEEFEALMLTAKDLLEKQEGLRTLRLVTRAITSICHRSKKAFPRLSSPASSKASNTCSTGNLIRKSSTAWRRKIFMTAIGKRSKSA